MAAVLFMCRTWTPWALLPVRELGCGFKRLRDVDQGVLEWLLRNLSEVGAATA